MKNRPLNLLLLLEAIVLLGVIALVLLTGTGVLGSSDEGTSSNTASDTTGDGTQDNTIDMDIEEDTSDDADSKDADSTDADTSDIYERTKLSFSDEVESILNDMTTEEMVAQLFVTTPDELTGVDGVTAAGAGTQSALEEYPVAGLVYTTANFSYAYQTEELLSNTMDYAQEITGFDIFLIVEELGGSDASPVATTLGYHVQDSPAELAESGSTSDVTEAAEARAEYLTETGFNAVLGPIADAAGGEDDDFDALTYGSSALNAADYIAADISALRSDGLTSIVQAFPGVQEAADDYSAYQAAIDAGVTCIQVSNVTSSDLTGSDETPCTLSVYTTQKLRDEMGFDGILMTDDLSEKAITGSYDIADAAVAAVRAGMNLLYLTDDFEEAYQALLDAVEEGDVTETMLWNSAGRVLEEKLG